MKLSTLLLLAGLIASTQSAIAADAAKFAETVLYSFCNQQECPDGAYPNAALIDVNGTLYGTTEGGGANNRGAVFSLDPDTGVETVIYSFCSQEECADGQNPQSGLIAVKGKVYGATMQGGAFNYGTVYSIDPGTGAESVLHSFDNNGSDGFQAAAGLIDVKGILYGTTEYGGSYCSNSFVLCGTVFSVDPVTGIESVLHSFGNTDDGWLPQGGLIVMNGRLYGTTRNGGHWQGGTIFSIDPKTGAESVAYGFCHLTDCPDGLQPTATLLDVEGILYGTTSLGGLRGRGCISGQGCGVVFSFDPGTGAEQVLHLFKPDGDGLYPLAGLIAADGKLYGTTSDGGAYGGGTVFSIGLGTGVEKLVYSFCSQVQSFDCLDGSEPFAGLIARRGILYGTTYQGGSNAVCYDGCGTVFALTKP